MVSHDTKRCPNRSDRGIGDLHLPDLSPDIFFPMGMLNQKTNYSKETSILSPYYPVIFPIVSIVFLILSGIDKNSIQLVLFNYGEYRDIRGSLPMA